MSIANVMADQWRSPRVPLADDSGGAVAMVPRPLEERFGFFPRAYNTLSQAELGNWLEHTGFDNVRRWRARTGGAP